MGDNHLTRLRTIYVSEHSHLRFQERVGNYSEKRMIKIIVSMIERGEIIEDFEDVISIHSWWPSKNKRYVLVLKEAVFGQESGYVLATILHYWMHTKYFCELPIFMMIDQEVAHKMAFLYSKSASR